MKMLQNCIGKKCAIDLLNDQSSEGIVQNVEDGWIHLIEDDEERYLNAEYIVAVTIINEDKSKVKKKFRM